LKLPEWIRKYDLQYEGKPFVYILLDSLKYYFRTNVELINKTDEKNQRIYQFYNIGETGCLHRNNFDEFSDLILEINNIKRPEPEKLPEFKNERQRDVYMKLMEGRRRKSKQDNVNLVSIANAVQHGGKSFISYKEIMDMTIPQLYNSYSSILGVDFFEREYSKYLTGEKPENLDLTHWSERLKL
jgi:hypothetical protein